MTFGGVVPVNLYSPLVGGATNIVYLLRSSFETSHGLQQTTAQQITDGKHHKRLTGTIMTGAS